MAVQVFKKRGFVRCVKCGWIAVDIPAVMKVTEASQVGISTRYVNEVPLSYYDIALNGRVKLHILRSTLGVPPQGELQPYFWEEYPF